MNLPDCFVHESFYEMARKHPKLTRFVNVKTISDLEIIPNAMLTLLRENDQVEKCLVQLEPCYKQINDSGIRPAVTSYTFQEPMVAYHIPQCLPRYVIWTLDEILPINATFVDRVNELGLWDAFTRCITWSSNIELNESVSICVFDLDATLIDNQNKKLIGADEMVDYARAKYDKLVLWSHGSSLHVVDNMKQFKRNCFDLILHNAVQNEQSPKNLLYLYNCFPNVIFNESLLVDDSVFNYCPEYKHMIVPTTNNISALRKLF